VIFELYAKYAEIIKTTAKTIDTTKLIVARIRPYATKVSVTVSEILDDVLDDVLDELDII
jgi:macrodomain Ter protein organizer (MatP/YcbG family)